MQPGTQPGKPAFQIQRPPAPPASSASLGTSAPPVAVQGMGGLARGGVPLWLPLPFLVTGILGSALFGLLLPWVAPQAILAPGFPHVLTLVHTATLGWLTMTIMGASLQLAPVILTSPLRADRLARWHYPIYILGVALMLSGFWFWLLPLLIIGGSLVALAVAHYAVIMGATLIHAHRHAEARPLTARYLAASLIQRSPQGGTLRTVAHGRRARLTHVLLGGCDVRHENGLRKSA